MAQYQNSNSHAFEQGQGAVRSTSVCAANLNQAQRRQSTFHHTPYQSSPLLSNTTSPPPTYLDSFSDLKLSVSPFEGVDQIAYETPKRSLFRKLPRWLRVIAIISAATVAVCLACCTMTWALGNDLPVNGIEDNEYDTRDRIHTEDSEVLSYDEIGNAYDVHQGAAVKTVTVILAPSAFKATASAT
ncbi:hypothetical protein B0A49_09899 [Cryomyces minteri]|uniref:Uncharacterized protein n=1 Tax=Cryomyces minteri TaxID=331657 RepID=A0A4V5NEW9_9PEZI|nr:hypothetical protein B0A49_09899 [Cryomyces minteri]